MMWQVASTRLWKEVFQIKNINDIHQKLIPKLTTQMEIFR